MRAYAESLRPAKARDRVYAATYFPLAPGIGEAQPLGVSSGQELFGIDFTLLTVKTHVVGGRLVDPSGDPLAGLRVTLTPRPGGAVELYRAIVQSDGRFRVERVPPGDYMLAVADAGNDGRWRSAVREITVVEEDVVDLAIAAEPPATIEGRFVRDDGQPVVFDTRGVLVELQQQLSTRGISSVAGRPNQDGTFTVHSAAGTGTLRVTGLPPTWIVKTTHLDGIDVTDEAFTVGGTSRRRLDILITNRGARLAGAVTDRMGRFTSGLVVLFPAARARWTAGSRLIRTISTQRAGQFELSDLPAADYLAVAVTSLPRNAWTDPDVLDRLSTSATPIRVVEGQRHSIQLRVVPPPADLLR